MVTCTTRLVAATRLLWAAALVAPARRVVVGRHRASNGYDLAGVRRWIVDGASPADLRATVAAAEAALASAAAAPDDAYSDGEPPLWPRAPAPLRDALNEALNPVPAPPASRVAHEFTLRFDGGSRGNPGAAGGGAVLCRGPRIVWCGWFAFSERDVTNNARPARASFLFSSRGGARRRP